MTLDPAIERAAALAAFIALPEDERAATLAKLDEATRRIFPGIDWTPDSPRALHQAFSIATACTMAQYHRLPVPLTVLLEDQDHARVIWALSQLLATCLRGYPEHAVVDVLQTWGRLAAHGVNTSDPETPEGV